MKTALRHPSAGMDRLCRGSRSSGSPDDPSGRRAFLAAPLFASPFTPLLAPLLAPLFASPFTPLFTPLLLAARGPAPAGIRPVERAGWILDASDR